MYSMVFQFLVVRLEAIPCAGKCLFNTFQFLVVRLEVVDNYGQEEANKFQFLVVRLEANALAKSPSLM